MSMSGIRPATACNPAGESVAECGLAAAGTSPLPLPGTATVLARLPRAFAGQ